MTLRAEISHTQQLVDACQCFSGKNAWCLQVYLVSMWSLIVPGDTRPANRVAMAPLGTFVLEAACRWGRGAEAHSIPERTTRWHQHIAIQHTMQYCVLSVTAKGDFIAIGPVLRLRSAMLLPGNSCIEKSRTTFRHGMVYHVRCISVGMKAQVCLLSSMPACLYGLLSAECQRVNTLKVQKLWHA